MDFTNMIKKKQSALQKQIESEKGKLLLLAAPIADALSSQRIGFSVKFRCDYNKLPHKLVIYTRKPRAEVVVMEEGYTLYDGNSAWPFRYKSDIPIQDAQVYLAEIIARSRVKTPCGK